MARNLIVPAGTRFGRLTVIKEVDPIRYANRSPARVFLCVCDCSTERSVRLASLRRGATVSCGCFHSERSKESMKKTMTSHGMSGSKLYLVWCRMKSRCYCEGATSYRHYGGRGISVCDEWRNSFEAFAAWAMSNGWSELLELDRRDVNGDYAPCNCRFVTHRENAQNTRLGQKYILTFHGKTQHLIAWSQETGISVDTLKYRVIHGWSTEQTLGTPVVRR